jgi:hypothetical protein
MSEHVDSVKTYTAVWLILLILTGVTTAVAYVDLGAFSVVALFIAAQDAAGGAVLHRTARS